MIYMKHPELGNKHVPEAEQAGREAAGWVRWPRGKEQKASVVGGFAEAMAASPLCQAAPSAIDFVAAPVARKKPGPKPKKA